MRFEKATQMETPAYNSLEKPCVPRPSLTESTRTKRTPKARDPAPKGVRASSRVCRGEARARTESGDEAGRRDDRLLHDEDLELLHHGHGCRFCLQSSASPSRTSPAAVAGDETRDKSVLSPPICGRGPVVSCAERLPPSARLRPWTSGPRSILLLG